MSSRHLTIFFFTAVCGSCRCSGRSSSSSSSGRAVLDAPSPTLCVLHKKPAPDDIIRRVLLLIVDNSARPATPHSRGLRDQLQCNCVKRGYCNWWRMCSEYVRREPLMPRASVFTCEAYRNTPFCARNVSPPLKVIRLVDNIFKREGLSLRLRPYSILCCGDLKGLVECVTDAKSVDQIKKSTAKSGGIRVSAAG